MKLLITLIYILSSLPAFAQRDADGRPCDNNIYQGGCKTSAQISSAEDSVDKAFGLCAKGHLKDRRFILCPEKCKGVKTCVVDGEVFTVIKK